MAQMTKDEAVFLSFRVFRHQNINDYAALREYIERTEPIVEAEWKGVSPFVDSVECTHCRYELQSEEMQTPRCPWCGAHMKDWEKGVDADVGS